jgi:hypothetical protein
MKWGNIVIVERMNENLFLRRSLNVDVDVDIENLKIYIQYTKL